MQLALECLNPKDFEVLNSHTTVDAPETVYHIRQKFKELESIGVKTEVRIARYKDGTPKTMWNLIERNQLPPTRFMRYCCSELKEQSTPNRMIVTGVRQQESIGRRGRNIFSLRAKRKKDAKFYSLEHTQEVLKDSEEQRIRIGGKPNDYNVYDCKLIEEAKKKKDIIVNPIYEWTDSEVWEYLRDRKVEYNPLYDEGFYRVGCIGCPLAGNQIEELERYPIYKRNYINAFQRMVDRREKEGKHPNSKYSCIWVDGESVYHWWVNDGYDKNQMTIDEYI